MEYSVQGDVMKDKIAQGYLYDFYGELLNVHHRTIFEDFVLNDLSLSEIAELTGFSDEYYFNRFFKKRVGITPAKYRKAG